MLPYNVHGKKLQLYALLKKNNEEQWQTIQFLIAVFTNKLKINFQLWNRNNLCTMETSQKSTTPGDNMKGESCIALSSITGPKDSGQSTLACNRKAAPSKSVLSKLNCKGKYFLRALNMNSLLNVRKLKELTRIFDKKNISILALHETRFTDKNVI